MNRILIAAGDPVVAETARNGLSQAGYMTAVVADAQQLIDFCRQHHPDLVVVDLDLPGGSIWAAAKALKGEAATASIPLIGVASTISDTEIQHGRSIGFADFVNRPIEAGKLTETVQSVLASSTIPAPAFSAPVSSQLTAVPTTVSSSLDVPVGDNEPIVRLRALTDEIINLTLQLAPHRDHYGEDGPELFGYIEGSGQDIHQKLNALIASGPRAYREALHDKEIRHDFRNMIGSVTGFSELILMESAIPDHTRPSFTRIRECSRTFVELLDGQKEAAAA